MSLSLTERISAHPRRGLVALLLFLVVAFVVGGPVAGAMHDDPANLPEGAESGATLDRIEAATGLGAQPGIVMLVEGPEGTDPTQGRLDELAADLDDVPGIARVDIVASDESLVVGVLDADAVPRDTAEAVSDALGDEPDVLLGGPHMATLQIGEAGAADLARAELFALPLLVVLSILFFRGRAAWLPVVVGLTTVLGTFVVLAGINQLYGLSVFSLNLVIGLGLGLAIDYSLFLLTRYREELERHGPTTRAITETMRTAGRTVLYSAATVTVALATLTVFPINLLVTMGIAGASVATVAAIVSLLVTPIFFSLWGAKLARRRKASTVDTAPRQERWYRFSRAVMRRPGTVAIATTLIMLLLALPALRVAWTPVDSSVIPLGESARTVSDRLAETGEQTDPLIVAMSTDDADLSNTDIERFAADVSALDGAASVNPPRQLDDSTWQLSVLPDGASQSDVALDLVEQVRDLPAPMTVEVGGAAAQFVDQQAALADGLPLALTLLLGMTLLILWLMTGSVLLPLKAVVMNVLTVGTALGALIFIYQDGRFTDLLGYTSNGGVEPTNFLVAAALVFALSTDYGVFLLGRIKEVRDTGVPDREAVAVGLGRTGSVVTAAAILLAVAIGAFSTSSISFIQQIGVATAVGVLVDAFIVRSLLVPSLMALMGRWNWWSPPVLRRLHDRVGLSEGGTAIAPASPVAAQLEPELVRTP